MAHIALIHARPFVDRGAQPQFCEAVCTKHASSKGLPNTSRTSRPVDFRRNDPHYDLLICHIRSIALPSMGSSSMAPTIFWIAVGIGRASPYSPETASFGREHICRTAAQPSATAAIGGKSTFHFLFRHCASVGAWPAVISSPRPPAAFFSLFPPPSYVPLILCPATGASCESGVTAPRPRVVHM